MSPAEGESLWFLQSPETPVFFESVNRHIDKGNPVGNGYTNFQKDLSSLPSEGLQ